MRTFTYSYVTAASRIMERPKVATFGIDIQMAAMSGFDQMAR